MISLDLVILLLFIMATVGYWQANKYSEKQYDNGFLDAVQLHSEGRLTYSREKVGDDEDVLTIEVYDEV